jgi:exopolysaccharide biosynthesis protein
MVPEPLRSNGNGVDLKHLDSRLAIGQLRDGQLLLALTRYDIGGGMLRPVPIGPTTPEMAAIMGALGCSNAVALDGGISSQLLLRDAKGSTKIWSAYRWVPLGLVATPR